MRQEAYRFLLGMPIQESGFSPVRPCYPGRSALWYTSTICVC